jgi:hypothetical protein
MKNLAKLSDTNIAMKNGAEIPALGFGTLIPNLDDTVRATKAVVEIGFRQFDCAERYRNEEAVGEAFQEVGKKTVAGTVSLLEAENYVALLTPRLFRFTAFHFPVGRTYSFSSSQVFFSCEACMASSWVNGPVQYSSPRIQYKKDAEHSLPPIPT